MKFIYNHESDQIHDALGISIIEKEKFDKKINEKILPRLEELAKEDKATYSSVVQVLLEECDSKEEMALFSSYVMRRNANYRKHLIEQDIIANMLDELLNRPSESSDEEEDDKVPVVPLIPDNDDNIPKQR
jgi:hypothetical protein